MTLSAIQVTSAAVSAGVKPTRRQKPRSTAPTTVPPIVTVARDTRCNNTFMREAGPQAPRPP